LEVEVRVKLVNVEGMELTFDITAWDEIDKISEGTHKRYVINAERFRARAAEKIMKSR